jgi:imidazolonepropionase-like amidohydrolase
MTTTKLPGALLTTALLLGACSTTPPVATAPVTTAPYVPDTGSIAVHCGTLIDGVSDTARHDVTVLIRAGRIEALQDGRRDDAGLPLLELGNRTCLPGLIDMHTHLTDRPEDTADLTVYMRRSDAETARLACENATAMLLAGFTGARNVGTYIAWSDRALRNQVNLGNCAGPRIQASGFYLSIPGGGGDLLVPGVAEQDIPARVRMGVARGAEQFAAKAQLAVDGGADIVKVIASGAVLAYGGVPGDPEMTPAEIAAVVQVAHAAGRKVAAHAHGAQSIKEAILAGADTIEHASLIDAEGIRLAREHAVALSMDVYNGDYIDTEGRRQHWPEEFLRKNIETTEVQRQNFTLAHAAGVAIVFGTDAAVYPHGLNARQFPIMVARGMTPMEAIRSASSVAAHYMGWGDRIGRLAPGYFGDLIAIDGDPLQDISRLQRVTTVLKGGLLFKNVAASRE